MCYLEIISPALILVDCPPGIHTLTGLQGVLSANGPSSTTWVSQVHNDEYLMWTAVVSSGGTFVIRAALEFETVNFGSDKRVIGFTGQGAG